MTVRIPARHRLRAAKFLLPEALADVERADRLFDNPSEFIQLTLADEDGLANIDRRLRIQYFADTPGRQKLHAAVLLELKGRVAALEATIAAAST